MTSQNDSKKKEWGAKEICAVVIGICAIAYVAIFLTWSYTNSPEKRPSSLLWDNDREGYIADPLHDRYGNHHK